MAAPSAAPEAVPMAAPLPVSVMVPSLAHPAKSMLVVNSIEPPHMVDIGHHAFADIAAERRNHGSAAWRHVQHLAGIFLTICKHVTAKKGQVDTLEMPMRACWLETTLGPSWNWAPPPVIWKLMVVPATTLSAT